MPDGVLVGYSMGARMALHTALLHPHKVEKLVLVSGTAGIDNPDEREQRRISDNALADRIEAIGVADFINEWLSNAMFANLSTEAAQIPNRLKNTARGLANSLRFAGTGTQFPLWNSLHQLQMPVLLITGENDQKFTLLAQRMSAEIPHSQLVTIPSCGHTVHLEKHEAFTDVLKHFLL
jgi:2-succinyl-6-hydroxy-2,4-cyclohexadiene-1-carboxylate synthase